MKEKTQRYSLDFGKKEKVLNYACQTYQLTRPNKVGRVMELIRQCQPQTIDEWDKWYFENAHTVTKSNTKITKESLSELGERLYTKITEIVIPEWQAAFSQLTLADCIDYIHNLVINRTYDGFIREKSVVNDVLAKIFVNVIFEESPPELDCSSDIDYIVKIYDRAFGIQIKPITANSNFGNYSITERMKSSFETFERDFGGKVFVVFSDDGKITNDDVIEEIGKEINRLKNMQ
ncbi:MAG: MjaI family restriction endonuclease [Oscillospiraceae bacterium]|nr:MjaI family restriction endonuclease [Oscillospiraceae bacterium]